MPLIDVHSAMNNIRHPGIVCACGHRAPTWGKHYSHVDECPMPRCANCLHWLPDGPSDHVCPGLRLRDLAVLLDCEERELFDKVRALRQLPDKIKALIHA